MPKKAAIKLPRETNLFRTESAWNKALAQMRKAWENAKGMPDNVACRQRRKDRTLAAFALSRKRVFIAAYHLLNKAKTFPQFSPSAIKVLSRNVTRSARAYWNAKKVWQHNYFNHHTNGTAGDRKYVAPDTIDLGNEGAD